MQRRDFLKVLGGGAIVALGGLVVPQRRIWAVGADLTRTDEFSGALGPHWYHRGAANWPVTGGAVPVEVKGLIKPDNGPPTFHSKLHVFYNPKTGMWMIPEGL